MRIAILGAGAWGTALAHQPSAEAPASAHQVTCGPGVRTTLAELVSQRINRATFPRFPYPIPCG